ncbi:unnamed protein product [Blepharisma stoltei]|uniref:Actin-related protein 5 n=1 Tax=Blepharisma stoltei TaxID=1481888 RepID=A0AAU9IAJ8_9CILI|nr:unnamed protein product [Blepharisma stoltei]
MEIPVFDLKGLPVQVPPDISKLKDVYLKRYKQTGTPIIIDNGSFNCRVGWAGSESPILTFRNIVSRQKTSKEVQEVLVGSEIPEADLYKLSIRSPFERDILQHFHTQEHVFDYLFWALGINEDRVNHPIVVTETVCSPNYSRQILLEMLFEGYQVPKVNLGVDSLFSFRHNLGANRSGLVVNFGHQATHILPCLDGEFLPGFARRINVGGNHCTQSLLNTLQTRYFYNRNLITWPIAQEIVYSYCYTAVDYFQELENLRLGNQIRIQLPWVMPQQPTDEELKRKQQQRREQGKKLREISAKKNEEKKKMMEQELCELENIASKYRKSNSEFQEGLVARGISNFDELKKKINILKSRLNLEVDDSEKYNLVDIPDEELSAEQQKQKKLQKMQKAQKESREQKKAKENEEKERIEKLKQEDPAAYLEDLRKQRLEIQTRIDERNKIKVELQNRHSRQSQRRLRAIAELGNESSIKDDNFGVKDQDWDIYRDIHKDTQEEDEEDQVLLADLDSEIAQLDPNHLITIGEVWRPPTAEDYQIYLETDRIRPPEIVFQPSIIGLEQAGLVQTIEQVLNLFSPAQAQNLASCIFLTGASVQFPNFKERLEREIMMIRPFGSEFNVVTARDPALDAWRGASDFSLTEEYHNTALTKEEYDENGQDYLKVKQRHLASNSYFTTPNRGEEPTKRQKVR